MARITANRVSIFFILTLFTLVCGWGMLCFGKLSEAHGRLHVPKCVAAWADMYHDWHELFMNEEPRRVGVNGRSVSHEKQTVEPQGAQTAQQNQTEQG
ncbi:hypothetical protein KBAD14_KBAD14_08830 [Aeromonas dhakensis]|nr:hypothetical protein KBAD45_08820 [Aeromonas dhakensis]CAD7495250.1 hypothetical protein KBAD59_08840 [Aeromonas dhakensis]CAD7503136.1 hypothetical protein KBAD14_KBAD14_08830 [Aeromonas dhakensis]CAD7503304.1 hypothetical protein KBAD10_08840 [Aeromonas dhakensis]CAD7507883.1 hypothetical protein KBAD05_08820 [Aeromonas dhakensis]